jgi:hypothetical protein
METPLGQIQTAPPFWKSDRSFIHDVAQQLTPMHRRALLALDGDGAVTSISPSLQRSLQELRQLRVYRHIIAQLVRPVRSNALWRLTELGQDVRCHVADIHA